MTFKKKKKHVDYLLGFSATRFVSGTPKKKKKVGGRFFFFPVYPRAKSGANNYPTNKITNIIHRIP